MGSIDISVFANIIKYNCDGVEDSMLVNFQKENTVNTGSQDIDYQEFFKK